MTANLLDAGDKIRLDREAELTEQAPRQLPQEDRSPVEEPAEFNDADEGMDTLLDSLLDVLRRRM